MKANKIVVALVVITLGLTSCYYHNWETLHPSGQVATAPCIVPDTVSYSKDIVPIINASCGATGSQASSCHGSGSSSGYDYTSYSGLYQTCKHDSSSLVYGAITGTSGTAMPLGGPLLDKCTINKIVNWLNQGAPQN
jgi:hypothetical protein